MLAAAAMAANMIESRPGVAAEMAALVAMPDPVAAGKIPKEAVIAPIAVLEGAIIAVIITVVISRAAGPEADIDPLTGCAACHQGKHRNTSDHVIPPIPIRLESREEAIRAMPVRLIRETNWLSRR